MQSHEKRREHVWLCQIFTPPSLLVSGYTAPVLILSSSCFLLAFCAYLHTPFSRPSSDSRKVSINCETCPKEMRVFRGTRSKGRMVPLQRLATVRRTSVFRFWLLLIVSSLRLAQWKILSQIPYFVVTFYEQTFIPNQNAPLLLHTFLWAKRNTLIGTHSGLYLIICV